MNTETRRLAFADLVVLEPALRELYERARDWLPIGPRRYCELVAWRTLKPEVVKLVGSEARSDAPALLRTSEAYDLAYQTIYHTLPRCTHDGECW